LGQRHRTRGYWFTDDAASAADDLAASAPQLVVRLVDRTAHETLNEHSDEGSDPSGVELAVDVAYPTIELGSGDLFARVPLLKSVDDLGDLVVVHRLDL
jgi:hypothetical protein